MRNLFKAKEGMCMICGWEEATETYNTKDGLMRLCKRCCEKERGLAKIERLNEIS